MLRVIGFVTPFQFLAVELELELEGVQFFCINDDGVGSESRAMHAMLFSFMLVPIVSRCSLKQRSLVAEIWVSGLKEYWFSFLKTQR